MQLPAYKRWFVNGTYRDIDGDIVIKMFGFIYITVYKLHHDSPSVMVHLFKEPQ